MTVGFVLLAHKDLQRVAQLTSFLCSQGAPVVLHIDADCRLPFPVKRRLERISGLQLLRRRRCRWGGWSLVDVTLDASCDILRRHPELTHVALLSGNCVPVQSIDALRAYLGRVPSRDFIQSVQAGAADWVVGGLQMERFLFRFPFCYARQRRLFDLATQVQRRLPKRWSRRIPERLTPSLGSQWWCLSRQTLRAILEDPELPRLKRYFRSTWIPDEAFFQSMVRLHSDDVEARSLTWSPFDDMGRPITLYDDHLAALRSIDRSYFFARKVSPGARSIYDHFLNSKLADASEDGRALQELALRARHVDARPTPGIPNRTTSPSDKPYLVLYGPDAVFPGLGVMLQHHGGGAWLGPQFEQRRRKGPRRDGDARFPTAIARANPVAYLANLLRDQPGRPILALRPGAPKDAMAAIAADPKATIVAIKGAWTIPLHKDPDRSEAAFATNQRAEKALLAPLTDETARSHVHSWTLQEALARPAEVLMQMGLPADALQTADTSALSDYLEQMRDAGLNPTMRVDTHQESLWQRTDFAAE